MDVMFSRGQHEAIVPEPPLLIIKTSGDALKMESPIFKLPIELTMLIFQQYRPNRFDIRPKLTLTHICRRWRHIAVNDASLWTNISIKTGVPGRLLRLDYFESILGMQLDRTANLMLDVTWTACVGDNFYVAALRMIREKAPFSRWRSLWLGIIGYLKDEALWSSAGEFTNLESLVIGEEASSTIIGAIDRTITSRLRVLEVTSSFGSPSKIKTYLAKSLTQISSLSLHELSSTPHELSLPANVVNLDLDKGRWHAFPHIRTYKLWMCRFTRKDTVDLRSMTVLIVGGCLYIDPAVQVSLPALREISLGALDLGINSVFEAPALDSLHFFTKSAFNYNDDRLTGIQRSLLNQGYLLSPNSSITADSHLPLGALLALLTKSPKATRATLSFDGWEGAQVVLNRLGFKMGDNSDSPENETLYPRLSELRLDFGWELSEPSASKEWLLGALKYRRELGILPVLSVYASWKGEGTYVMLTGD